MSKTILEWNDEVFNLLMEYRSTHPGFTFAPRTKDDKKGRFRSGQWFQGNAGYIFVGLSALGDVLNKTKTIGFVLTLKDGEISRSYVEVVFNSEDNRKRSAYFKQVLDLFGIPWEDDKYKYDKTLPMHEGLKKTLFSFLDTYWSKLLQLMTAQSDATDLVVTEDRFAKYIEKKEAVMALGPAHAAPLVAIDTDDEDEEEESTLETSMPLNLIIYGPPGTGKTYMLRTKWLPHFTTVTEAKRYEFVTFHQSYGYEEFIEGLRPVTEDGVIRYDVVPGVFLRICRRAQLDPANHYAIFIDEINRGNISRIFGELITLVEADKRVRYGSDGKRLQSDSGIEVTLPYSGTIFGVPANVHIIGTMNTADRSIALLDMALRRRFDFEEIVPDPDLIKGTDGRGWIDSDDGESIQLPELLRSINRRINYYLGRDLMIGHAYFTKVRTIQDLHTVFAKKIIPLLQEYFYADWEKIRLILGDNKEQLNHCPAHVKASLDALEEKDYLFIISRKLAHSAVFGFGSSDQEDPWEYLVNPALSEGRLSPWAYRKIYGL